MPKQAKKEIIGQKSIDAIKPSSLRKEYPDKRARGLYLVVQPSGIMSWALRYRNPDTGKSRKFTLGSYPALSLEQARTTAIEKYGEITKGLDVGEERQKQREEATDTSRLIANQVADYIKKHVDKKLRPNPAKQVKGMFYNDILPQWGNKRVDEISKRDVVSLLNAKAEATPIMANRLHSLLSHFGGWLVAQGIIETSFATGTKKPAREISRDRVLSESEIKALWNVANAAGYPFGDVIRLLILTGARKSEISDLRWSEIDIDGKSLIIGAERMKGDREHTIPLSDSALDIIQSLPRFGQSANQPVFTSTGKTPVSGFSKVKARFDGQMKVALDGEFEPWRVHDIRRTVATGMAGLSIAPHIVEAALAHTSGTVSGVARVYNRFQYADEKRAALAAWDSKLSTIISGAEAGNVVVLHG